MDRYLIPILKLYIQLHYNIYNFETARHTGIIHAEAGHTRRRLFPPTGGSDRAGTGERSPCRAPLYSRAKRIGIYTPPPRKGTGDGVRTALNDKAPESGPGHPKRRNAPNTRETEPIPPAESDRDTPRPEVGARKEGTGTPPGRTAPASTRLLTERLHAMAELADALGEMEERVHALERERETEAAKNREAVRALDRLARVLEEASGTVAALRQLYEG
jgi:hypothetical protein